MCWDPVPPIVSWVWIIPTTHQLSSEYQACCCEFLEKKFQNIILPHCVKANKWIGKVQNLQGDIVNISSSKTFDSGFHLAKIIEAKHGHDGLICSVKVLWADTAK